MQAFRDGLRRDLLLQCLAQAHPVTLMCWIHLAGEIEGRMRIVDLIDARDGVGRSRGMSSQLPRARDAKKGERARSTFAGAGAQNHLH